MRPSNLEIQKEEVWKAIPGYPGYEVSNQGRVRSYYKPVGAPEYWKCCKEPQRILSARNVERYPAVHIKNKDGNYERRRIHSLVTLAFLGPRPEDLEVCHNNDDPTNNRLENLRYDTRLNNCNDSKKFDEDFIQEIRNFRSTHPCTINELAIHFDVSANTAQYICKGTKPISKQCSIRYWKGSSQYRGVHLEKNTGKWRARIWDGGQKRNISLGLFNEEVVAARTYDRAAINMYGENAKTNFDHRGNE